MPSSIHDLTFLLPVSVISLLIGIVVNGCIHYSEIEVAQSCPTLCNPVDYSPPASCPWHFPGKSTGLCCHFLLQGIFSTQESNPGLPHCRLILYHKQPGTPMIQQAI